MGWTILPCTSGQVIRAAWFDEIRAAITERTDIVGGTPPADVAHGDLIKLRDEYRASIDALLVKFYNKTGAGIATTFTAWTKADLMDDVFGGGATDWPNVNESILRAQDFNDMRLVLNALVKYVRVGTSRERQAAYRYGGLYAWDAYDSKNDAQDDYDNNLAPSDQGNAPSEAVKIGGEWYADDGSAGPMGSFFDIRCRGGPPPIKYFIWGDTDLGELHIRDAQVIYSADLSAIASLVWGDAWVSGIHTQLDNAGASENDRVYSVYRGTGVPGVTFAAIRSYGILAGQITIPGERNWNSLELGSLSAGVVNYFRCHYDATISREFTDGTWGLPPGTLWQITASAPAYVYLEPVWEYGP